MRAIAFDKARAERWDVLLVGTSFAACFFARKLRGRGLRVLFVERGPFIDRDTQLANRFTTEESHAPQDNRSEHEKLWVVRHQFGGCSNCWWGNTPRLHPSDFELNSRYGVGVDWPIGFEALEPYLLEAEQLMEVAGGEDATVAPRSAPYPFPPHRRSRAERRLAEQDPMWTPMPTARANGGRRGQCCASGTCGLCPVDVKFTILNSLDLFDDPNFFYVVDAEARSVATEAGAASGVVVRRSDGTEAELAARFVGLAANAISNAAILLRSGLGSDLVGRGLHEQAGQFAWIDIPFDNYYGGTSITGAGWSLYDGDFRREAASIFIESWNAPPSLRLERDRWLQRLKLKFIAEDLPRPENRVVLDAEGEAKVVWVGHSDYAYAGLARARSELEAGRLLPFAHDIAGIGEYEPTEAHIQGGTPMASDAGRGVVDADLRVFGVAGLACLGAGVFPTCGAANPTLTLSALSLRAGERL